MAEIEDGEHGDAGRARQWMARAVQAAPDPAWTADGVVSETWLPVSPVTGRLDAFQWKVPVLEIGIERPILDVTADIAGPAVAAALAEESPELPADAVPAKAESVVDDEVASASVEDPVAEAALPPLLEPGSGSSANPARRPAPSSSHSASISAMPVVPLIPAPDDPGLGGTGIDDRSERESATSYSSPPDSWLAPRAVSDNGRRRWFQQLFR
jgi:HemY protein